jgi:adenylate cyclase
MKQWLGVGPLMSGERVERRLAAILAGDIAGYSRLMGADEEGTLAALKALRRELVDPKIKEYRGRIVKTTGDGMLVEFASVVDAVRCAVDIQRDMAGRNAGAAARRIEFRMGINVGDIIIDEGDIYGDGVNVAARLEALAEPGGICVSRMVRDQVRDKLDFAFEDQGEQQVKNIARPVHAFAVRLGSPASSPDLIRGPLADKTPAPQPAPLPLPDRPSIAVLPFQNMSGDPEQEYFADGMVEDILTALSRIRWLFVIARNSSFTYKGTAVDVKQVARELGVRYVLEGSVRRGGNRVRITAQLIDTETGAHVWAERYDRDLTDIFAVQDEITASVAGIIEPALAQAEQQRVMRKLPERLDAWEAYQRGLFHCYKFGAEDNKIAQSFFRQAIALDPNFAPGHYGYVFALWFDTSFYFSRPNAELLEAMLKEARIAVALDDKDAMSHLALATAVIMNGSFDAGLVEARAALALNPNNAQLIASYGAALIHAGRPGEAIEPLRQAMRASPQDPLTWHWFNWVGMAQLNNRDFESALETYRTSVQRHPEHFSANVNIVVALGHLGRLQEARAALDHLRAQFPEPLRQLQQRRPAHFSLKDYALRIEGLRLAGLPEV